MVTAAFSTVPGFTYQNGTLWLPVENQSTKQIIRPQMTKGDFGSLMPYFRMSMPDIFDSVVIPYENIVSFEWSVFGQDSGKATLHFLDSTPIFIEEMILRSYNKPERIVQIEFGWRIQNMPPDLSGVLGTTTNTNTDGLFITEKMDFQLFNGSYQYTNYGILGSLELNTKSLGIAKAFKIKVGEIDATKLPLGEEAVAKELTNIINTAAKGSGFEFRVFLKGNINTVGLKELKTDGTTTIDTFVDKIAETLYPQHKDGQMRGLIQSWFGNIPISTSVDQNNSAVKPYYPIYFYEEDALPLEAKWKPIIEFPANETPILSWNPEYSAEFGTLYSVGSLEQTKDAAGNEKFKKIDARAIIAGRNSPRPTTGEYGRSMGTNRVVPGRPIAVPTSMSITTEMLGDPRLTSFDLFNTMIEVRNSLIIQPGLVTNFSDFWKSFPGIDKKLQAILPVDKNIRGDESAFSANYNLMGVKHKISSSEAFKTELKLYWLYSE